METTRTILSTANVADYLWPEAADHEYKSYKVYDMTSNRVRHTRDCRVHSNSEDEMIRHAFGVYPNVKEDDMTYQRTDLYIPNPGGLVWPRASL